MSDVARGPVRWLGAAGIAAAVVVALALVPAMAGAYTTHVAILALFAVGLAVSYRPLLVAGQVSLAHGALYAIGAYGFAILSHDHGVNFWVAALGGGAVAIVAAMVIGLPSLRTAGAYFFLITFAFAVVITSILQNFKSLTGGFAGISGIAYPPGVTTEDGFYTVALIVVLIVVAAFLVFDRSQWGLELRGLGASTDLAESVGVSRLGTLLIAFGVGAFFAGVLGAFYASFIGFIAPQSFDLWLSVSILTSVIVGGVRYWWGPIVGAAFITLVPLLFHWKGSGEAIFGAVSVIVVMFVMRRGIATEAVDLVRRRFDRRSDVAIVAADEVAALEVPDADPITPGPVVLTVRDIAKSFGGVRAVRGISFDVHERETLGIVGPNGSGKTTTFNLISGFVKPDQGDVRLRDAGLARTSPHRVVRHGLARSFQASAVFSGLTVLENVLLASRAAHPSNMLVRMLLPVRRSRRHVAAARAVLAEVDLLAYADLPADALPYGHKKVLGVAIGLATNPTVLCLDEPATGMTETEIAHLTAVLRRVRARRNLAMVIIEHRLAVIRDLCDRVVALRSGEVIAEGSSDEVLSSEPVVTAFLGSGAR